jgi:hypothetical protein
MMSAFAAAVKDVVHGVETKLSNEDAGRFLARMSQVREWLGLHCMNKRAK